MSNTKLLSTLTHISTNTTLSITDELIAIDTCNNRIGINTINPQYSIDISGQSGETATLKTYKLIASSIDFSGIPDISTGLTNGYLYKDNGFISLKVLAFGCFLQSVINLFAIFVLF